MSEEIKKKMPIQLNFRTSGSAYARAAEVANFMELDMESYLLECIKEGHKVLKNRKLQNDEFPTFLREKGKYPLELDFYDP